MIYTAGLLHLVVLENEHLLSIQHHKEVSQGSQRIHSLEEKDRKFNGLSRIISPATGPIKRTNRPSRPPDEGRLAIVRRILAQKKHRKKKERESYRRLATAGPTALAPGCYQLTC